MLLIRFLKAERNVGQGALQDSYGRMGKMGLSFDIECLSYRSHCLFFLPPLPGTCTRRTKNRVVKTRQNVTAEYLPWKFRGPIRIPVIE